MTDNTIVDAVKKIDGIDYRRGGKSMTYRFFGIGWKNGEYQEYLDNLADSWLYIHIGASALFFCE